MGIAADRLRIEIREQVNKNIENESSYTPAEREQMNRLNNIETIDTNENILR